MAEYALQDGDTLAEVAKELIEKAGDPSKVAWAPRPDTPHGGVFVVDDEVAADVLAARRERREADAQRVADAQKAADERDERANETGATPAELGYPANAGTDPGSAAYAARAQAAVEGKLPDADPNPAALAKAEAIRSPEGVDSLNSDLSGPAKADADVDSADEDDSDDEGEDKPEVQTPAQKRAARKAAAAKAAEADASEEGK